MHNGAALMEVMLSEGGPPCMHYDKHYSSQTKKVKYELWPDIYYSGCPKRTINGKTYENSEMFEPVANFLPVSEYAMIKQNKGGDLWTDYVKHFRAYKIDVLKDYMSTSYSKSYTKWNPEVC